VTTHNLLVASKLTLTRARWECSCKAVGYVKQGTGKNRVDLITKATYAHTLHARKASKS
jgi:hypothetical protein